MIVWLAMWSANCRLRAPLALSKIQPRLATRAKAVAITVAAALLTPGCVTNPDGTENQVHKHTSEFFGQMNRDFQSLKKELSGVSASPKEQVIDPSHPSESERAEPKTPATEKTQSPLASLFGGVLGAEGERNVGGIAGTLNKITATTLLAMGNFNEALGEKNKAEVLKEEAKCAENGTCAGGMSGTLQRMQDASDELKKMIDDRRANQVRLEEKAARQALDGIIPAIKAAPLWVSVSLQSKAIISNRDLVGGVMLIQALPRLPSAVLSTKDMLQASVDYISFSGIDTSSVDTPLLDAM